MRGNGRIFPRGRIYWISYYVHGEEQRESARTDDPKRAERFLRHRMREVGADQLGARTFVTPQNQRRTIHELNEALRQDYELRGKLSPQGSSHLARVDKDFGQFLAATLSAERIDAYIRERLEQGDAASSINRTCQLLGQGYKLAIRRGHLAQAPAIRHLSEAGNERQGFLDEPEFRKLLSELPNDLKDFVHFAYLTGMRKGEVASLRWADLDGDVLRLQARHSKNRKPRSIPLVGELGDIIKRRKAARQIEVNGTVELTPLVFHRLGQPICEFRKSWASACRRAGIEGHLFHDLRRSAVRNMSRAGIAREVAKRISGHETDSMFTRYNIIVEDDVREAMERTQQHLKTVEKKVVSIAQ